MRRPPALRWLSLAAVAFGPAAYAQTEAPLTYRAIRELPPAAVALRLLGPERGGDVVRIESRREPMLPATLEVMLFHRPVPLGSDYCSQSVHRLYLFTIRHEGLQRVMDDDGLRVQNIEGGLSLARAPACRLSAGQRFASIGPTDANAAMRALDNLAAAQAGAATGGRLPIQLTCRDEVARDPDRCRRGARALLANLPLNRVCSISREQEDPQAIEAAICLTDSIWAPGAYWSVRLRDFGTHRARLSLTWKDPAPF
jgi:hypothetical protein